MICKQIEKILNKPEFICMLTIKWFQVFLIKTNNSILY